MLVMHGLGSDNHSYMVGKGEEEPGSGLGVTSGHLYVMV